MRNIIILSILLPLLFGFVLFGSGSSGGGFGTGFVSSNKVFAPTFLNVGGGAGFSFTPMLFRPTFQPIGPINAFGSFRWNFFDP